LLALVVLHASDSIRINDRYEELKNIINELELKNYGFDWLDENSKSLFQRNVDVLKQIIQS
jgi:hypothetical protein